MVKGFGKELGPRGLAMAGRVGGVHSRVYSGPWLPPDISWSSPLAEPTPLMWGNSRVRETKKRVFLRLLYTRIKPEVKVEH